MSVVFHGRNVPLIQRSVVKRVEGLAYDHVAVEIEHAFQLFGEQVGEETAIVGGCREAGEEWTRKRTEASAGGA